ncbi:uncharacterized protein BDV17DRAFT_248998 [Aspergillus undulatus]|uniref:uncharacterized protein n=1 Tax=Aspergillus undulatus TaxID=1810928 RepID=UPI003CCDB88B
MVSQAGNNGVISLTGSASRRADWTTSAILILMGIVGKFGAVFGSMPPSILGAMQVFLYSTIAVAGVRVLGMVTFTRRNRFILSAALEIGFMDIVSPEWFSPVLAYEGDNGSLQGFLQGANLIVETPFITAAVVGVVLNAAIREDEPKQGRWEEGLPAWSHRITTSSRSGPYLMSGPRVSFVCPVWEMQ